MTRKEERGHMREEEVEEEKGLISSLTYISRPTAKSLALKLELVTRLDWVYIVLTQDFQSSFTRHSHGISVDCFVIF